MRIEWEYFETKHKSDNWLKKKEYWEITKNTE